MGRSLAARSTCARNQSMRPPINPTPRPHLRVMWDGNRCGGGALRGGGGLWQALASGSAGGGGGGSAGGGVPAGAGGPGGPATHAGNLYPGSRGRW
jgi:hypothetical protein